MKIQSTSALLTLAFLAACSGNAGAPVTPTISSVPAGPASNVARSCDAPLPGDDVQCFAVFRLDVGASGDVAAMAATPAGYGPSQIQSAYKLPSTTAGSHQTVGIVDAYDNPNAEKDLAVYRAQFGLPPCTTANGCFKKVNQRGTTSYPTVNGGWAQEISLDLDMVSATCPQCHILLVEASGANNANLASAENEAIALGADVVSNSYGGSEVAATNSAYNHPGHIITASAGDSGTGAAQPCSYATVVCVGGTSLWPATNARGWSEAAWTSSGSGCSAFVAKPSWQTDTGCSKRSETDVSAVADPETGVAVYDSYAYDGHSGWMVFGGTSASSPIVASVYALAGNEASLGNGASSIWSHASSLFGVTSGTNGSCAPSYSYICNARPGYDGPTGWGTPDGITAF